jgi:hypothetical protein
MAYDARKRTAVLKLIGEDYKYIVDFASVLQGRSISSASRTSINAETKLSDTTVCPDAPTVVSQTVSLRLTAGTSGVAYWVMVYAILNTAETIGHLLEVEVV